MTQPIVRENASVIQVGSDLVFVTATKDGRGVFVENGQSNLFIPKGDAGKAILSAVTKTLAGMSEAPVKRTRRSSEEVQAERADRAAKWAAKQAEWAKKRDAKSK